MSEPTPINPEMRAIEQMHRRESMIVNARPFLARVFLGTWVAVDAVFLAVFAVVVVGYVVQGSFAELRQAGRLDDNLAAMRAASLERQAHDLEVGAPRVLASTSGAYDVYAIVENPNTEWYATFSYAFAWSDETSAVTDGFVMPGETKFLLALNVASGNKPSSPDITIADVAWHRVNRHDVADTAAWLVDHGNFLVTQTSHDADIELAEDRVARSLFTVENATPYSYWEPTFTVVLTRGGSVVGVHQATVSRFAGGDIRDVEVHWSGEIIPSGTLEVYPNINYFSENAYMTPSGEQATDVRDIFERRRR